MLCTVCPRLPRFMDETRPHHQHPHLNRQLPNFARFSFFATLRHRKYTKQYANIIKKNQFYFHKQASSTYTLQIKDIQETDAGFYQCQVLISATNRISAEVELQVRRPPIISDNSTRSIVVSEGEGCVL